MNKFVYCGDIESQKTENGSDTETSVQPVEEFKVISSKYIIDSLEI